MTDDEILERAAEIKEKRERAARGRRFMEAKNVQLVAFDQIGETDRIFVPQDPELAAILCRLLGCEISEK
ncbi:hypothetical protein [uncultured Roseobacter sp.]|uniref:hypothetical protein n=1 Tax=uncultured Roseobacter sp. TaxID=114847 RepID=UPI002622218A|nr:hypothetical protein [uncultured Roseobacter sp.]